MRTLGLLALAALLAACSPGSPPDETPGAAATAAAAPAAVSTPTPAAATGTAPEGPVPAPPGSADSKLAPPVLDDQTTCGADRWQSLVGKRHSDLPPAQENWRVHSLSQPVTEDLRPDRMNVIWDDETGRVLAVRCG